MSSANGGAIVGGLALTVLAGCLNGSWNVPFSPTHGIVVRRSTSKTTTPDLTYPLAWILFQVYAMLLNIPICITWAGGLERVQYIVQEASIGDILIVCIISMLWGIGSVGFGLACQIAGVGLGTNLCMGVITVLGTFLPLCTEKTITTPAGGVVVAGVVICCLGLALGVQSLQIRDNEERIQRKEATTTTTTNAVPNDDNNNNVTSEDVEKDGVNKKKTTTTEIPSNDDKTSPSMTGTDMVEKSDDEGDHSDDSDDQSGTTSTFYKVAVCFVAGVLCSQLQFAFVFGDILVDLAESEEGPGTTPPSGITAVLWLFAISLGTPASIVYGLYSKSPDCSLSDMYRCPWYRHALILLTTSIPWLTHIHLYGYANTLLPPELGASVLWPVLMMTTVLSGILWSLKLGEWSKASNQAKMKLYQGLILGAIGVGVIMVSVAV